MSEDRSIGQKLLARGPWRVEVGSLSRHAGEASYDEGAMLRSRVPAPTPYVKTFIRKLPENSKAQAHPLECGLLYTLAVVGVDPVWTL